MVNLIKRVFALTVVFIFIGCSFVGYSYPNKAYNALPVKMIAHRGLSHLFAENSMDAFKGALVEGYWAIEFDVQVTKDGEFVVMHDYTIDRTTNGSGSIDSMTSAQLREYRIDVKGSKLNGATTIPTMDEVLAFCSKNNIVPVIELKKVPKSKVSELIGKIKEFGLQDKAIIIGFGYAQMLDIVSQDNSLRVAPLMKMSKDSIDKCSAMGAYGISVDYNQVTKELVDYAHEKGIKVNAWTVNNPDAGGQMIDMNVDYITTDSLIVDYKEVISIDNL